MTWIIILDREWHWWPMFFHAGTSYKLEQCYQFFFLDLMWYHKFLEFQYWYRHLFWLNNLFGGCLILTSAQLLFMILKYAVAFWLHNAYAASLGRLANVFSQFPHQCRIKCSKNNSIIHAVLNTILRWSISTGRVLT